MDLEYESLPPVPLEIDSGNYRGDLHSSLGHALADGVNGDSSFSKSVYPDFSVDEIASETPVREGRVTVEDWLMYDESDDSYILVQGKSYGVDSVDEGINQLYDFSGEFRMLEPETYDNMDDLLLVIARPSGVKEPRTDFSQVERGIREEVARGGEARIVADMYRAEPPPNEEFPMNLL